jgi:hypothetical protein
MYQQHCNVEQSRKGTKQGNARMKTVLSSFVHRISQRAPFLPYLTWTTDAWWGNGLHCMDENQLLLPNVLVRPNHTLSATSAQIFRFPLSVPLLGVRSPCNLALNCNWTVIVQIVKTYNFKHKSRTQNQRKLMFLNGYHAIIGERLSD